MKLLCLSTVRRPPRTTRYAESDLSTVSSQELEDSCRTNRGLLFPSERWFKGTTSAKFLTWSDLPNPWAWTAYHSLQPTYFRRRSTEIVSDRWHRRRTSNLRPRNASR